MYHVMKQQKLNNKRITVPAMSEMATTTIYLLLSLLVILMSAVEASQSQCMRTRYNFERCTCLWSVSHHITAVNCTNTFFSSDRLLKTFTQRVPDVEKVIFTGNSVNELSPNIFGNCSSKHLDKLTYVDLSSNQIHIIHGKTFHCAPNLKTLLLNRNQWIVDPNKVHIFSSLPKLTELHLDNAFYSDRHASAHMIQLKKVFNNSYMYMLEELHLDFNQINYIDKNIFCHLPALKRLFLTGNDLTKLDFECLNDLQELHLDGNRLTSLSRQDISRIGNMTHLSVLDISNNPFECTECTDAMGYFRDWLNSAQSKMVTTKHRLVCQLPKELQNHTLVTLTNGELEGTCRSGLPFQRNKQVTVIVFGMIFISLFLVLLIVGIINRDQVNKKANALWESMRKRSRSLIGRKFHYGYATMSEEDTCTINT